MKHRFVVRFEVPPKVIHCEENAAIGRDGGIRPPHGLIQKDILLWQTIFFHSTFCSDQLQQSSEFFLFLHFFEGGLSLVKLDDILPPLFRKLVIIFIDELGKFYIVVPPFPPLQNSVFLDDDIDMLLKHPAFLSDPFVVLLHHLWKSHVVVLWPNEQIVVRGVRENVCLHQVQPVDCFLFLIELYPSLLRLRKTVDKLGSA